MLHGKTPTLSWFSESPYLRPINVGSTPSDVLAINCKAYKGALEEFARPEVDALDFYAMNHLMAVVNTEFTQNEPLEGWAATVAQTYLDVIERQATRMLYYMILITTRESRHVKNTTDSEFYQNLKAKFGPACYKFNRSIKGSSSDTAAQAFMDNPPAELIGRYLSSLTYIFNEGMFGGGYGGKPWGMIAQTLEHMLTGQTSMEVMLDTAYTLAHNNGPMFNKGMMYHQYSHEIYRILDVQRSGQVPEMILNKECKTLCTLDVMTCLQLVRQEKPKAFGTEVDWQMVKDLGALKDYSSEIQKQADKKPKVTKQGFPIVGQIQIMPGKAAQIFTRKKAA